MNASILKNEEKAVFDLRALYKQYGFTPYKMSKFETYDLYVRNKNFLVSDHIITFNDTNGKLMALKPDVTLSIIKRSSDLEGIVEKYCYNENVYRVSGGTKSFREIMQAGLECIGAIDDYNLCETVMLAAESMKSISRKYILDISHMDIIASVIEDLHISRESVEKILSCIADKNLHEMQSICRNENVGEEEIEMLTGLASLSGKPDGILPRIISTLKNEKARSAAKQLKKVTDFLELNGFAENIRIDFSVLHDMHYYNGIVFKGFIEGIPEGILSGGQYNQLMRRMGKKSDAIGFAVYLDMLERLQKEETPFDVDALLLCEKDADVNAVSEAVKLLKANGKSVMVQKQIPDKVRYKQLLRLQERGLEILENNA